MQIDGITIDPDKYMYVACYNYGPQNYNNWFPIITTEHLDDAYGIKIKRGKIHNIVFYTRKQDVPGLIYSLEIMLSDGSFITINSKDATKYSPIKSTTIIFGQSFVDVRRRVKELYNR